MKNGRNVNMANFMDSLQKEMDKFNSGNRDNNVEYPSEVLKHDQLYFNKDNSEFTVRILPNVGDRFFAQEFREIFLNATNKNQKELNLNVVIGANDTPDTSNFLRELMNWQQEERVPNRFNKTAFPSKRYFVNVVKVQVVNGQPVMETDENGQLVVRVLKLPVSAYQAIVSKLSDPMLQPQGADEFGFIGVQNAYPVRIVKPAKGSGPAPYSVDVYQRDLGPLPQGWESLAEDLAYQATPTEEYNGEYLQYIIDVVNGNEPQGGSSSNSTQQGGSNFQPQQAAPKQQQNQGFNAPQQNQGSAPQQNTNQGFNAPQQQAAPQQQNQGWSAPQQNQGFSAPQQAAPQQQKPDMNIPMDYEQSSAPQQQPQQPSSNQGQGQPQDINSVLDKMRNSMQD